MVISCVAWGCTNRQEDKDGNKLLLHGIPVSFHRFPNKAKNLQLHQRWVNSVKRWKWSPTNFSYICGEHFLISDYKVPPWEERPRLKTGTVPTIYTQFPQHLQPSTKKRKTKNSTLHDDTTPRENVQPPETFEDPPVPEVVSRERSKRKRVEKDMQELKKKYKTLQQKLRRKEKKIESMKDVINVLKNRKWISESKASNLEDHFSGITGEVFRNQLRNNERGATGRRYSEEFKQFALTVYFYSPKAYNFLRKVFYLPHQSSVRNWISSVDCEPGFLSEAFADLQRQIMDDPGMTDCALILDGMSIRKQILFCQRLSKYVGFTDYGNIVPEGPEIVATEALVFMLVGLKSRWKCPVGYFLIDKTDAETQSSLVKQCIKTASDNGLRIRSVTCDGTNTNFKTLKLLGCVFGATYDSFVTTFKHPSRDYVLYGIPDACHMLKNARNCLGNLKILKNSSGGIIKWEYINSLHELQVKVGLNLANKLNSTHIQWSNHKMKVKVAAQTLSSSVADALDFLENVARVPEFQGCGPTVEFIRNVDKLFDFLNSRHRLQTGYKQPSLETILRTVKNQFSKSVHICSR